MTHNQIIEFDLLSYPHAPASAGTDTSREGAEKIAPAAAALRDKVLTAVTEAGANGSTVLEMCQRHDLDRVGVQPRFSELRALRKIMDSGLRRKNPSGVSAIVWTLPEFVTGPCE